MGGADTGASLPGSANQYISPYNNSESMSNKSNNLGLRPRGTLFSISLLITIKCLLLGITNNLGLM